MDGSTVFEQAFKNVDDILHKDAGCTDKALEAEVDGRKYDWLLPKKYRWESWAAPKGKDGKLDHNKARSVRGKLLAANKRLNTAYLLKESFGQLWSYRTERGARAFFERWKRSLRWQRLEPYQKFVRMIERHWDGIAAYCHPDINSASAWWKD